MYYHKTVYRLIYLHYFNLFCVLNATQCMSLEYLYCRVLLLCFKRDITSCNFAEPFDTRLMCAVLYGFRGSILKLRIHSA